MSENHSSSGDYKSLNSSGKKKNADSDGGLKPLRPKNQNSKQDESEISLVNYPKTAESVSPANQELPEREAFGLRPFESKSATEKPLPDPAPEIDDDDWDHNAEFKQKKREKRAKKDFEILNRDSWVQKNGHYLTYIGLYCFSILVLYRPYELVPGLGFLSATAFYVALATLAIFIPTQLATEGTLTYLSFEVKMILVLTIAALISIPIAKSKMTAWSEFNDVFIKAVLMFIVMVNVVRTRSRLKGMTWLSMGIAVILSCQALLLFWRGDLGVEGYRVGVDIGGMFGNPNDLALHLVMMSPLAFVFGIVSKSVIKKFLFFGMTGLFTAAIMVTYSRGAFLGLLCISAFLIWKLGKEKRMQVLAVAGVLALLFIILAPGNYGVRLLSIFVPGFDGVGSRDQRKELLWRSILVSIRNPWGIGIGNFPIVGIRNLVTHNSYTQVSSELGVFGLLAYVLFLFSPFRKLAAIERRLRDEESGNWFFYLSVGLQASLLGYCVSSFFVSVAYGWFIYYLVAYAVAFRRIYMNEYQVEEEGKGFSLKNYIPGWQG